VQTGITMVSMETLSGIQTKLDRLIMLTAQDRLNFNAQARDSSIKKSIISDPFLDDTLRDQGLTQTAAIVNGSLMLPVGLASTLLNAIGPSMLGGNLVVAEEQARKTGSCKINPYLTGTPPPATVTLTPSCDHWVTQTENFTSPVTRRVVGDVAVGTSVVTQHDVLSAITVTESATIRVADVEFNIYGFAPTEVIVKVIFDAVQADPSLVVPL
jgi:hypothetical protein